LVACGSISSGLLHASDRRYGTIEDGQKVGISPSPTPSDPVITLSRFCAARSTLIMLNARALSPLSVGRSKFKAFVKKRLRTRPRRWAHFEDSPATQCPRCDKGQHRACIKLQHCTAKDRSPPGTGNKREKERASKRATKKATMAAKEAFAAGLDTWMRRLRNVDIDGTAAEEEEAGVADHEQDCSWMRRLRFDDGSDGAGGGGGAGLAA